MAGEQLLISESVICCIKIAIKTIRAVVFQHARINTNYISIYTIAAVACVRELDMSVDEAGPGTAVLLNMSGDGESVA